MSGRLGNCTIGKRRGNESPVKRLHASQALSRRSLILNMGRGGSGLTGRGAGNASVTRGGERRQATASDPHARAADDDQPLTCPVRARMSTSSRYGGRVAAPPGWFKIGRASGG